MNEVDASEMAFNMTLFKQLGCYQILSPHSRKVFGCNVYRLCSALIIVTTFCGSTLYGWVGFFVDMEDTVEDTMLLQTVFIYLNYYLSVFKMYKCMRDADKIWGLLDVTRMDFAASPRCGRHVRVLHRRRHSSIKITNFLCVFITATYVAWLIFPLVVNNLVGPGPDGGGAPQRLENVNNFRYPVSIDTFRRYYYAFFAMEAISGLIVLYGILLIDVLLISVSYVFIAQYEMHKMAFADVGYERDRRRRRRRGRAGNENDCNIYYDDFKSILIEHQKLNLKLELYYSIVWPIIVATVAVTSGSIILLAYSFVMIFMAAEYIPVLHIIKLGSAFFFLCIELFIHCYLFEIIEIKKEIVTFGIYCSNWTAMDLKFKKLVLLTMRMNDANKLLVKFSPTKTVNLQFFANVMMTCYNTVSVMLKAQLK